MNRRILSLDEFINESSYETELDFLNEAEADEIDAKFKTFAQEMLPYAEKESVGFIYAMEGKLKEQGITGERKTVNFKGSLSITVKVMSMVIFTPMGLRDFGVCSKEGFMELTTKCL